MALKLWVKKVEELPQILVGRLQIMGWPIGEILVEEGLGIIVGAGNSHRYAVSVAWSCL